MAKAVKASDHKVVDGAKESASSTTTYTVIQQFNDKHNFSVVYHIGEDVSHFDEVRLNDLITKGLVEKK